MFSSKQFSFDHRHAAYTGAQRHHDDLGETPGGSGVDFPEQCHARVVLNREGETESLAPPSGEIESWSILILCVCRQHSCRTGIDKPRESRDHTLAVLEGEPVFFCKLAQSIPDSGQQRREALDTIRSDGFLRQNRLVFDDAACGVGASQINR